MTARGPDAPAGFAEFVAARSSALLRSAWLLTGDQHMAEDLLQTALAASWRRWSGLASGGDPEWYVRRVLVNTYLSWRRRRWWREQPSALLPDRPSAEHDQAMAAADRDAVRRALARLTRQQRAVVVLRYAEDLSVVETAQLLGCSPNTVKVQASRALAVLRTDPDLRLPVTEEVPR
jgi:RNA polymerase sigma-70 factor (sigma-E family)